MQFKTFGLLLVAATHTTVSAAPNSATDCADLYRQALATELTLSYEEFDQTPGRGFRRLAENSCPGEAADLIEAYIAATGADQTSLIWHIAQMRAEQGDYESAIAYARKSLRPTEEPAERPLRWNDYVLAVIAFLEGDREALIRHRNHVAAGAEQFWGNALNRDLLDKLIAGFGRPYNVAVR